MVLLSSFSILRKKLVKTPHYPLTHTLLLSRAHTLMIGPLSTSVYTLVVAKSRNMQYFIVDTINPGHNQ